MEKRKEKVVDKVPIEAAVMPEQTAPIPAQSVYNAKTLIDAHDALGYPKECVMAAFKFTGLTKATFDEAKNVVKSFMERVIV